MLHNAWSYLLSYQFFWAKHVAQRFAKSLARKIVCSIFDCCDFFSNEMRPMSQPKCRYTTKTSANRTEKNSGEWKRTRCFICLHELQPKAVSIDINRLYWYNGLCCQKWRKCLFIDSKIIPEIKIMVFDNVSTNTFTMYWSFSSTITILEILGPKSGE